MANKLPLIPKARLERVEESNWLTHISLQPKK
jgi:hypothetical protein